MPPLSPERVLARTALFHGLPDDELRRLGAIGQGRLFAAGQVLLHEGDEPDGLHCLVAGLVSVFLTAEDGRQVTVNLLEPGEVVGEIGVLDGRPRSAGAQALTETETLFLPRAAFRALMGQSPALAGQVVLALCERLRQATEQLNRAAFEDLRARLLLLLRQLAFLQGEVTPARLIVELDLSQGDLAQLLGATRESVNKQLRALQREGLLQIDGRRLVLTNVFRAAGDL